MTTTTKPLTYGAAAKVATSVNTDELRDLIALDDNPDIFPGKGKTRRVGWNLRINTAGTAVWLSWDCAYRVCDLTSSHDSTSTYDRPIFNFERLSRIVRWEAK